MGGFFRSRARFHWLSVGIFFSFAAWLAVLRSVWSMVLSMSDLARVLSEPPAKASPKCGFRDWLVRQPEEDQKAIESALNDERWTVAALLTVLAPAGLPIKENRLRAHRIGACACGPREQ